jgi:membrane-associated protease RseP (regulator of RpoE activity)
MIRTPTQRTIPPANRIAIHQSTRHASIPRHVTRGFLSTLGVVSSAQIVHEVGHLIRAKHVGAKVDYISLGVGPIMAAFDDKDGTIYVLRAVPLWGRVKFGDEFDQVSGLDRAGIHLAGPVANILFACMASLLFLVAHDHIVVDDGAVVERVITGGAAAKAGIMEGDIVRRVNGVPIEPNDMSYATAAREMVESPELEVEIVRRKDAFVAKMEPFEGRSGWELKPAVHTEEIVSLAELPSLIGEDLKMTMAATTGTMTSLVTGDTSSIPIRPEALLNSPYHAAQTASLNFALLNLLSFDGWRSSKALVDFLVFNVLKHQESEK